MKININQISSIETVLGTTDNFIPTSKAVSDSISSVSTDVEQLQTDLLQEVSDRQNADNTLSTSVSNVASDLTQEIIDRAYADSLLIPSTQKASANGVATLNSSSKLDDSQIPDSLLGSNRYKGFWDASTNTPTIPSPTNSNKGWYYIVTVEGSTNIDGITDWKYGDWIISNGTSWGKVDNTDAVVSVNGQTGIVNLSLSDITSLPISIAQGGTNKTNFTAPVGNLCPIVYFDGTSLNTDSSVGDLGYDTATDTVHTGKLYISSDSTQTAKFINTATSSSTGGGGMLGYTDDGAAMSTGDRLAYFGFGGAIDSSHNATNSSIIQAFATENWDNTKAGSKIEFLTTSNGTLPPTGRTVVLTLNEDKSADFSSKLRVATAPTASTDVVRKAELDLKENIITTGTTSQYYRGDKTFQTLDKTAVGLPNVDNTSDLNKPVSIATQTALNLKANIASPTFTGTVSGISSTMVGLGNVPNVDATNPANIVQTASYRFVTDTNISNWDSKQSALGYTPENIANKGINNGYASLDSNGLIPVSQIPPAALERIIIVANQAARYALTIAQAQNGDTIKQTDTGEMWYVVDQTNLNNSTGYSVYTAGAASSVAWSGITGIPDSSTTVKGVTKLSVTPVSSTNPIAVGDNDTRIVNAEQTSNKVTTFSSPTDVQYPSAKLVNDQLSAIIISTYATVGTGGNYATVAAAFAAGKTNLKFLSNVTDSSNCIVTGNVNIELFGFTWTMTGYYINVLGTCNIRNGNITFGNVGLLEGNGSTLTVYNLEKLYINNVSVSGTPVKLIRSQGTFVIRSIISCTYNMPNVNNTGICDSGLYCGINLIQDLVISGGGANITFGILQMLASSSVNGLYVNCTTASSIGDANQCITLHNATNIYLGSAYNGNIWTNGTVSNIFQSSGTSRIQVREPSMVSNVYTTGEFRTRPSGSSKYLVTNLTTNTLVVDSPSSGSAVSYVNLEVSSTGSLNIVSNDVKFENANFHGNVTLTGSNITCTNCTFYGTLTIVGNFNKITNSYIGTTNGGTKTITINAGATKTVILGCTTEANIVDNGTTTGQSLNNLF